MLKTLSLTFVFAFMLFCTGCKNGGSDSTANWEGVYTAANLNDTLNSIIITNSGNNSLRVQIKSAQSGYVYNYTTLQHVTVTNVTQATINEHDYITGGNGSYNIQGTLNLSSPNITLSAIATGPNDVKYLNFSGSKTH